MRNLVFLPMVHDSAPPPGDQFVQTWEHLAARSRYCRHRLAKLVQISVRTLDRHFQKQYSQSVCAWLLQQQMAEAYQQVLTGKTLKEISYDVGFKQPSHFTRRFKSEFGVLPSSVQGKTKNSTPKAGSRGCVTGDPFRTQTLIPFP